MGLATDSTINVTADGNAYGTGGDNDIFNDAYGVYNNGDGAITVTNSTISATASGDAEGNTNNHAYGISAYTATTISDSTIKVAAGGDAATGNNNNDVVGVSAATATVSDSRVIINSNNNFDPISGTNGGSSGNICIANGDSVDCF